MIRARFLERNAVRRVVIKIGTSLISDAEAPDGVNHAMIEKLRDEVLYLKERGVDAMLVSSGAVGTGRHVLKAYGLHLQNEPSLTRRQALSAIGQSRIVSRYAQAFAEAKIPVAQLLITARDFRDRRAYLNIGHTIQELRKMGALAIINENDTVSTDELQFGDNDLLSAVVASLFRADLLMILTSVEGFLVGGERVAELDRITKTHRNEAGGPEGPGRGGMSTKIRAGELCGKTGGALAILPGEHPTPIRSFFDGEDIGTFIHVPQTKKLSARKQWLLFARAEGGVIVDAGAAQALTERGSSLLSVGVHEVRGRFLAGEVVEIEDANGRVLGRGIAGYSSREIQTHLKQPGDRNGDVVIHRNDLMLED
ncbi:MAG: glutamate 5-kinase [bacterium]|nr:glutamate 5-kinase [bacterium]